MPKKKRSGSLIGSPFERKMKYDHGRGDVMVARDRLKGALQDLCNSDDESSSSQEESSSSISKTVQTKSFRERDSKPPIIRRRKRKHNVELEMAFQHTFVMKLFDRSVDLAQFKEDTPLYPICRAWIANQPRVPLPYPETPQIKNEVEPDGDYSFNGDNVSDVHKLPSPDGPAWTARIPPLKKPALQGVDLNYSSSDNLPSANELLSGHLSRWGKVRRQWIEAAQTNEARFNQSGKLLSNMYKSAQNSFIS